MTDETRRPPAPPWAGEGPHALWHVSDKADLGRLAPRITPTNPDEPPLVWAVDTRHQPLYWFPRDCPRGCLWADASTSDADVERWLADDRRTRVHLVEQGWHDRVAAATVYAHPVPGDTFRPHEVGGYWVSDAPVDPGPPTVLDDLLARHVRAGIVVRVVDSLARVWPDVVASTLAYSGIRLRNAAPPIGGD